MTNEVKLKLTIDGKEAIATLDISSDKLTELGGKTKGVDDAFTQTYKKISSEVLKFNAVTEASIDDIASWIQTQNISQDTIEKSINSLQQETRAIDINSDQYSKKINALNNLNGAYAKVMNSKHKNNASTHQTVAGAGKMNLAFNQMGYVINDANMFLVDFRMGLMGVGNNIPMVVQMLASAKAEVAAVGGTIKTALVKSLMGTGGLMIAINGIMFLMQFLPALFGNTTKEVKKQADEVNKLAKEYENLSTKELEREKNKLLNQQKIKQVELESYKGEYETKTKIMHGEAVEYKIRIGGDEDKWEATKLKLEEIAKKLKALNQVAPVTEESIRRILDGKSDTSTIKKINEAVKLLQNEFDNTADSAQRNLLDAKIKELESKKDSWVIKDKDLYKGQLKEIETQESHNIKMAELENKSSKELLKIKADFILQKIDLNEKHNKSTVELQNELVVLEEEYMVSSLKNQKDALKDYYNSVKWEDENYRSYKISLIDEEASKQKKSGLSEIQIEQWVSNEIKKLDKEKTDYFKKLKSQEVKDAIKAAKAKLKAEEEYYQSVSFDDESYYDYRVKQIEEDASLIEQNSNYEIDTEAYKLKKIRSLNEEYFDWKWQKFQEDYSYIASGMDVMLTGYDTFWNTILDKDMTGTERWIAMRDSMYSAFVGIIGNMLKSWIQNLIVTELISDAMRTAEITKAAATGTAIANAYAPAAAFASTMSFGGAAIAGSAGLISTVSLAQILANTKFTAYETGGAIVGENGLEIIAPAQDFASGMDQLVIQTISTVEKNIKDSQDSNTLNNNSELLKEVKQLNVNIDEHLKNPVPSKAYMDDKEARKLGREIDKFNRKSKL